MQLYEGPPLPPDQVATIQPTKTFQLVSNLFTDIVRVDGRAVGDRAVLEVLPGTHTVLVGARFVTGTYGPFAVADHAFQIDAQAGHAYLMEADVSPFAVYFGVEPDDCDFTFWVEDDASGDIVAEKIVVQGMSPHTWKPPVFRSRFGDDETDRQWAARAFDIPGGSIQVGNPRLVIMESDVSLQLDVKNRTADPVRVDVRIPFSAPRDPGNVVTWWGADEDLAGQDGVRGIHDEIGAGSSERFAWQLGWIEFEAELPMTVLVARAGEGAEQLGQAQMKLVFEMFDDSDYGRERIHSIVESFDGEAGLVVGGFPEVSNEAVRTPGTNANADLAQYVANKLYREESRVRAACAMELRSARPVGTWTEATSSGPRPSSVILAEAGEELAWASVLHGGPHAEVAIEVWRVQSCGVQSSYEVVFVGGYEDDAHVIVQRLPG